MTDDKAKSNRLADLRRRAEAKVELDDELHDMPPSEVRALVHELRTHQIELEMQNEELRRAQEELVEARDLYADLYDFAPVGYLTTSEKGLILQANLTAAELLGVERANLTKQRFSAFVVAEDEDTFYLHRRKLQLTGQQQSCELRLQGKDGDPIWVEVVSRLATNTDDSGGLLIRATVSDVTERKRAEDRFRATFELAAVGVVHAAPDGKFLRVNRRFCDLVGYSPKELLKLTFQEITYPDDLDTDLANVRELLAGGTESFSMEKRYCRNDGAIVWANLTVSLVRQPSGEPDYFIRVVEDIANRKQLEDQLRHTQKMEAVGQLAAGVAHEFNNLLFGILGSVELIIATQEGTLDEYLDHPLRDIKKCGQRGATLTRQLLAFASKRPSEVSVFDINRVVAELDRVLCQVGGELMTLELDLASDLASVRADRAEIEQTIMNLAINAHDAMSRGGTLTIRTAMVTLDEVRSAGDSQARPGPYVLLSVADTGCGMAPDIAERIFEPFFTTKSVGEGTGLGLSTVFADVTKSGGLIEVESRQGEGTVFRVYLPVARKAIDTTKDNAERSADPCPGGNETILVCDDDEVVLDSAAFMLETGGYNIIRALGAPEALKVAAAHDGTIDLLLTDVTMPEMNGWELSKKLIAQRPEMKVIYMSGYAKDVLDASAAEGEHIEFIEKPPEGDTLFRRIRAVLDGTREDP